MEILIIATLILSVFNFLLLIALSGAFAKLIKYLVNNNWSNFKTGITPSIKKQNVDPNWDGLKQKAKNWDGVKKDV